MKFAVTIYIGAFVAAAAGSVLAMPLWRRVCLLFQLVDDPGNRKIHAERTPLAGGLAVMTGIVFALALFVLLVKTSLLPATTHEQLEYGFGRRASQMAVVLCGALGMLLLGIIDDRWELRPAPKFCGQFLIALAVAAAGMRITLFVPSLAFSYVITILWILTIVNAFNFMDNMNGLCGGISVIASFFFGLSAAWRGEYLVAVFALLCCGAFCGFLPWNYPRATVFLGDSGSHLAGFLVAVLAILPHYYSKKYPHAFSVLTPLLVLAVPLIDLATVVIIRWRMGKPFYIGDTNHLSHCLVRHGFTPPRAVLLLWAAAFLLGALSILL